jgi:hypothetical protein
LQETETRRDLEQKRRAEKSEAKRIQELGGLAKREAETWGHVETLVERRRSKSYGEVVALPVKLPDLATNGIRIALTARAKSHILTLLTQIQALSLTETGTLRRVRM